MFYQFEINQSRKLIKRGRQREYGTEVGAFILVLFDSVGVRSII